MSETASAVNFFEIGSDNPEETKRFYGDLFGWTFADPDGGYRMITTGKDHPVQGGLMDTSGQSSGHAIFYVQVDDVAATVRRAEELGAKTLLPATPTPNGLVFAHVRDSGGQRIGVYSPPKAG
jgi:predicted enzyme related to lactoylglutathione lyase